MLQGLALVEGLGCMPRQAIAWLRLLTCLLHELLTYTLRTTYLHTCMNAVLYPLLFITTQVVRTYQAPGFSWFAPGFHICDAKGFSRDPVDLRAGFVLSADKSDGLGSIVCCFCWLVFLDLGLKRLRTTSYNTKR